MKISSERNDKAVVLDVEGRVDASNARTFEEELKSLINVDDTVIVVDFEKLSYISSAGLRSILLVTKLLRKRNASIAICSPNDPIREIFHISGFNKILPLRSSREQAIAALTSPPKTATSATHVHGTDGSSPPGAVGARPRPPGAARPPGAVGARPRPPGAARPPGAVGARPRPPGAARPPGAVGARPRPPGAARPPGAVGARPRPPGAARPPGAVGARPRPPGARPQPSKSAQATTRPPPDKEFAGD